MITPINADLDNYRENPVYVKLSLYIRRAGSRLAPDPERQKDRLRVRV
jgi:hypothetical protein